MACAKRLSCGTLASSATPCSISPPRSSARAVVPLQPSAPITMRACTSSPSMLSVVLAHVFDLHAVAHIGACRSRLLEQEVVEPAALRHQRQRFARGTREPMTVLKAASKPVDDCPRRRARSRTGAARAARPVTPPPQGLSRGKVARSSKERVNPRRSEPVSRNRPCWAGSYRWPHRTNPCAERYNQYPSSQGRCRPIVAR